MWADQKVARRLSAAMRLKNSYYVNSTSTIALQTIWKSLTPVYTHVLVKHRMRPDNQRNLYFSCVFCLSYHFYLNLFSSVLMFSIFLCDPVQLIFSDIYSIFASSIISVYLTLFLFHFFFCSCFFLHYSVLFYFLLSNNYNKRFLGQFVFIFFVLHFMITRLYIHFLMWFVLFLCCRDVQAKRRIRFPFRRIKGAMRRVRIRLQWRRIF